MYAALTAPFAGLVLGLVCIVLMPIPFIFMYVQFSSSPPSSCLLALFIMLLTMHLPLFCSRFGPAIRARSKHAAVAK